MTPTFRIHGYIGDGDNTSEAVGAFLAKHRGQAVDVIINSPGGDALEGGAIMAELQAHGRARCIVRGLAASSASFLLCGADTIIMHRAALLMLHSPWTMTVGVRKHTTKPLRFWKRSGKPMRRSTPAPAATPSPWSKAG